ncbi:DoxX family protein [Streptomonospora nanhaiensis]|uniref:DoxX family protein n=1 Tax=Streptomonospora nanhaiensis TaxID=1323731 RepID=A0ABY6YNJ2_9ACTN|nr:MauE/DoxX family redox-associated membrane protein [Streptomonospora nanhaiensis]WAE73788.1 DoxX family protein [Streptomonospora nanhaiensis]
MTPSKRTGGLLSKVRGVAPYALGGLFVASGVLHFAAPGPFRAIMPRSLPKPEAWVYGSGTAELVCGAGLLTRRRWAGPASAALLLAVWPANVRMALDSGSGRLPGPADGKLVAWGRVPLQIPLIWAALQSRPAPHRADGPRD